MNQIADPRTLSLSQLAEQPVLLDVREKDEFEAEHIDHSVNAPLSLFQTQGPNLLKQFSGRQVVIVCRSGNRAKMAMDLALGMGPSASTRVSILEGGILEWKKQGKALVKTVKAPLPLMRQVQLVVGSGMLASLALGYFLDPRFFGISAFFAAGLSMAGLTGFCPLANMLARMPWNSKLPAGEAENRCGR